MQEVPKVHVDFENPTNVFRAKSILPPHEEFTVRILKVEHTLNVLTGKDESIITTEMEYKDGKKREGKITGEQLKQALVSGDWEEVKG